MLKFVSDISMNFAGFRLQYSTWHVPSTGLPNVCICCLKRNSIARHKTMFASSSSFMLLVVRRLHQNVTVIRISQQISRKCAE